MFESANAAELHHCKEEGGGGGSFVEMIFTLRVLLLKKSANAALKTLKHEAVKILENTDWMQVTRKGSWKVQ